ncbi:MAG TPA: hypothetical protein VFZ01_06860 [Geminicoccaceae bacterium]
MSTTKIGVRRWRRIGSLLVLASLPAAIGGCAARSPLYYEYLEPAKAPAAFEQQVIDDSLAATRAKLIAGLEDGPFEITAVDPDGRFVVAEYSGPPGPYVDCGVLLQVPRKGPRVTRRDDAAATTAQIVQAGSTYTRNMRLDGRLVTRLEPAGEGTALRTDATYVVSKLIQRNDSDAWGRETIAFPTGERGAFARGTICQPTGVLEEATLAALERGEQLGAGAPAEEDAPEVEVAAAAAGSRSAEAWTTPSERLPVLVQPLAPPPAPAPTPDPALAALMAASVPDGSCGAVEVKRIGSERVVVEGVASDLFAMDSMVNAIEFSYPELTVDNRIEVLSDGACRAYRLAEGHNGGMARGARLEVLNLREGVLQEGEVLRLALGLPENRSHVHLSYFQSDGSVAHMELETPWESGADAPWLVDTRHVVSPPHGREFILAVATEGPLFDQPRPATETAEAFLPALEAALGEAGAGPAMTACAIVTTTDDRGDGSAPVPNVGDPCAPATSS